MRARHLAIVSVLMLAACNAYNHGEYERLLDGTGAESDVAANDTETIDTPIPDAMDTAVSDTGASDVGVDVSDACVAPITDDYCMTLPSLPQAPIIDGEIECGLTMLPIGQNGWNHPGTTPPADFSARYAVAYRPDGLYVFVHVTTPRRVAPPPGAMPYCGDGIEIYLDADGQYSSTTRDDPGGAQLVIPAPDAAESMSTRVFLGLGTSFIAWTSSSLVAVARPDGYDIEALLVAADLRLPAWSLAAAAAVGFDLAINIGTSDPSQSEFCSTFFGQFSLRTALQSGSCAGVPSCTTAAYCTPRLAP
jgi:hypothetical protein